MNPAASGWVLQPVMPAWASRVLIDLVGGGIEEYARCMCVWGARFCQNSVSLRAPEPQGGASSMRGWPSMLAMQGCFSMPGTFSSM